MKLNRRPLDHAYMKMTFADRQGKSKTIRLKLGCEEIDQAKQIKDFNIPANESFTQAEKDAVRFSYGVKQTNVDIVQMYLEASPQYEDFWVPKNDKGEVDKENGKVGTCSDIIQPLYKLYDRTVEIKAENAAFKKRLKAGNAIEEMSLQEAQDKLITLFGHHYVPPKDLDECQNQLVDYVDGCDESELVDFVKEESTADEKIKVLVGRAVQAKILDFDSVPDQVIRNVGTQKMKLIEISSSYEADARVKMFSDFLMTKEGKALANDLQKALEEKK